MKPRVWLLGTIFAASVAVACSNPQGTPMGAGADEMGAERLALPQPNPERARRRSTVDPILKVFVIVQENRSVDNLFNTFPNANTSPTGKIGTASVPLRKDHMDVPFDLYHGLAGFNTDTGCPGVIPITGYFCPMNDFTYPGVKGSGGEPCSGSSSNPSGACNAYAYVGKEYTKPYWAMALQYVFGDNMFQSQLDGSYTSHQYLIAANADSRVNFPTLGSGENCAGTTNQPSVNWITAARAIGGTETACLTYSTDIARELNAKSLDWRYYNARPAVSGLTYWNPFFYIAGDRYFNTHEVSDPCQFLTDVGKKGYTPTVTWITPSFEDSDHSAGTKDYYGPDWVASVVNAIGQSSYWNESVIFITWDDWGGWYDHVQPPYKNYDGLGVRVPFIIISPYIKPAVSSAKNIVTHVPYEQASILKYIEDRFGLNTMSAADARATDPATDTFWQLQAQPRPFATFSPYPEGDNCAAEGSPDNG